MLDIEKCQYVSKNYLLLKIFEVRRRAAANLCKALLPV